MAETPTSLARIKQRFGNVNYSSQPYWAEVEIRNGGTSTWVQKGNFNPNTGVSGHTMFPDGWSQQRVYEEVKHAWKNRTNLQNGEWEGLSLTPPSAGGFKIGGYDSVGIKTATADPLGNVGYDIATAFPKISPI